MLSDLIISQVRIKVLNLFFENPKQAYHVRDLVRTLHEEINAVRRELSYLEKHAILKKEPRGNRVYYSVRRDYPYYFDLIEIVAKTTHLAAEILKFKNKLGKIKFAMISGFFVRGEPFDEKKVDLLIVGQVVLPELDILVKNEQLRRNREMNFTVMSEEEFKFRKDRNDPFVFSVLMSPRIMIIGDELELVS
jgi:DNA-binding transcriptional ArsR family regulator